MERVTKDDHRLEPLPRLRGDLEYRRRFSRSDAERMMAGIKPRGMDDKWFVYSEDGWVYFVHSWTGRYVFGLELQPAPEDGVIVQESWYNADRAEFNVPDPEGARDILERIIETLFGFERVNHVR